MNRLAALVLLLAAAVPAAPAFAFDFDVTPTRILCQWVTQRGAGETEEAAYDNALYQLKLDYFVLRSTRVSADCPEDEDLNTPGLEVPLLCRAEIRACVSPKPRF
ncbi:MAG TPA: hypothetical protein VEL74_22945 [Thermoanaerobaculia bacterium]|nr:hypothetical protein [Thermoanaerobaculia bacterium]